jgi:chromosome segregation ATPase
MAVSLSEIAILAGGVSGFVSAVSAFIVARWQKDSLEQKLRAEILTEELKARARFRDQILERLNECEKKHKICEEQVKKLYEELQIQRDKRTELQERISAIENRVDGS